VSVITLSALPSPSGQERTPAALDAHLSRLQELVHIETAQEDVPPRRRDQQPTARQRLEQLIRQEAVDCYRTLRDQGQTLQECGRLLNVAPRTLRWWDQASRSQTIGLVAVGRPVSRPPLPVRQAILDDLKLTGPGIGVPTLQQHFPDVARAELADLLARYRAVYHARREYARVLHWQTPGYVWAADFTEPSRFGLTPSLPPIAGCYRYVLAVRDLASGYLLAWQALPDLTEEVTRAALGRLFAQQGSPLVLKVDNGSAFRAAGFKGLLEAAGVIPLYSPPACPMYNGAIEAAIGSLKKRTEAQAREQGRDSCWELADLAAALAVANASHPRRLNGRTPTSVWEARTPPSPLARAVFALTVDRHRFLVRSDLGIDQEESLDHWRQSAVDRQAIERALVEHGHLLFTRRRLPLTIRTAKVASDV
jgi:transposase InsO family protein